MVYFDALLMILGFYFITLFMGMGLQSLLVTEDQENGFYHAFGIGIIQTSFFLILGGFMGFSVRQFFWAPLAASALLLQISVYRRKRWTAPRGLLRHASFVTLFVFILLLPVLIQNKP